MCCKKNIDNAVKGAKYLVISIMMCCAHNGAISSYYVCIWLLSYTNCIIINWLCHYDYIYIFVYYFI